MPQGRVDDGLVSDIVVEVVALIDVINGFVASQLLFLARSRAGNKASLSGD